MGTTRSPMANWNQPWQMPFQLQRPSLRWQAVTAKQAILRPDVLAELTTYPAPIFAGAAVSIRHTEQAWNWWWRSWWRFVSNGHYPSRTFMTHRFSCIVCILDSEEMKTLLFWLLTLEACQKCIVSYFPKKSCWDVNENLFPGGHFVKC